MDHLSPATICNITTALVNIAKDILSIKERVTKLENDRSIVIKNDSQHPVRVEGKLIPEEGTRFVSDGTKWQKIDGKF